MPQNLETAPGAASRRYLLPAAALAALAALLLGAWGLYRTSSTSAPEPGESPVVAVEVDSILFEASIQKVLEWNPATLLRVDPRPLSADPGLVTFKGVERVMPDRVSPEAQCRPFAEVENAVLSARRRVLRKLGVGETDALEDARCPGAMIPPSPEVEERWKESCPSTHYRSLAIALPREGGAYWPDNLDERRKYHSREVYSVRLISAWVGPGGSVESSRDYVFERSRRGQWRFLEMQNLLIVE